VKTTGREVRVKGTVQGVGFRPFVYRLAASLGLSGSVRNTAAGVIIEVEGDGPRVEEFERRLEREAPPLARIASVEAREGEPVVAEGFRIVEGVGAPRPTALIPPDVAVCEECAREIADAHDRRFGYAFTNCTNCGPRFSIVRGIPYDRPQTTMAAFEMCEECRREYGDPGDRRFHAEPVACPKCGPEVILEESGGAQRPRPTEDGRRQAPAEPMHGQETSYCPTHMRALEEAARLLGEGKVVAIKGLGGYHLACDARNAEAVETLRARKGRGLKPFAIMVRDVAEARRVAEVGERAEQLLMSPESPVVIMSAKEDGGLAEGIAPRQNTVGVMLPYTPLHRLLLEKSPPALVMTSGNLAEEPIIHEDEEARVKLGPIADHILSHNREIAVPCDDSVIRVEGELVIPVRRARGYVPRSVTVDYEGPPVLAVGGQTKNAFCLVRAGEAILSQHIGDLDTAEVLEYFGRAVGHFEELFETKPEVVAHDLHPGYLSTQWAKSLEGVRLVGVQHHHAHVVSVMAELGLEGPVIGVAYDGTGYGADGTVWGGEILVADRRRFERAGHLRAVPMPGGEGAIRRPARMALSHLVDAFGPEEGVAKARVLMPYIEDEEMRVVGRQVERGINSPACSSMGRFFDAVAAMLGCTPEATYEGQPAMELEGMAGAANRPEGRAPTGAGASSCRTAGSGGDAPAAYGRPRERRGGDAETSPPYRTATAGGHGHARPTAYEYEIVDGVVDARAVVRGVVEDVEQGVDRGEIAGRFHETVARFTVEACRRLHEEGGPRDVVLCGGVMQNARLVGRLVELLEEEGLRGHVHREVPPNDGGMSLGQAVVAASRR